MDKRTAGIFSAIFLFLFIFNYLSPISFGDDYVYSFIWSGQSIYEPLPHIVHRVSSWSDLFVSQWRHYFTWGGRTVAHVLIQFFMWKGKSFFNVANTFVSILLIMEVYWCINKGRVSRQFDSSTIVLIFFLLWACTPGFGVIFFWVTGACNYLWTNVIVLGFLLPFFYKFYVSSNSTKEPFSYIFLMFVWGVLAGWTNENSVCWILIFLALFIWYRKKRRLLTAWMISGFIGMMSGYSLLMLAPGNYVRLLSEKPDWHITMFFSNHLSTLMMIFLFEFILWYFLLRSLYILRKINCENPLIIKEVFLVKILLLISFGMTTMMMFSPGFPARSAFSGLLYLIIAVGIVLRIQKEYNITIIQENAKKFLFYISMIFFFITAGFSFRNYYICNMQVAKLIAMVKSVDEIQKDTVLTVEPIKQPSQHEKIYTAIHTLSYEMSEDENEWKNVAFSRYYGIKGIRMLKENQ